MAKSAPAGGDKKMDIGIYRSLDGTGAALHILYILHNIA